MLPAHLSTATAVRQETARLRPRQTGLMHKRAVAVSASVAAGLAWLALLAFVAIPAVSWWQSWWQDKAEKLPVGRPASPAPTPVSWRFSVLDTQQQPFDRLPTWVKEQNTDMSGEAANSARMVARLPDGRVYLTGTHRGGCLIVTDDLAHSAGFSCGSWRPPQAVWAGSSSTAEPCGLVVVLVPDGYTSLDPTISPSFILAHGRNGIVFINSPSRPATSLVGTGQPPILIEPLPTTTPPGAYRPVGC